MDNHIYFEFDEPKNEEHFETMIREYGNALLNTNGGFLLFGVRRGEVFGIYLSRGQEDAYRLAVDNALSSFTPPIGPNCYRVTVKELERPDQNYCVIEVRISAGPIGSLYETSRQEVFVVKNHIKIGPLWPQELKELVIDKYKQELLQSKSAITASPRIPSQTETTETSKNNRVQITETSKNNRVQITETSKNNRVQITETSKNNRVPVTYP